MSLAYLCFFDNVKALEYQNVTKRDLVYEINGFYISGDYLIVNGWGLIEQNVQSYFDDSTHSYSLVISNQNNKNEKLIYNGTLLWTDKTELFRFVSTHRVCDPNAIYQDQTYCYATLQNIGFEFKIPLSDLKADTSYDVTLRMHAKRANLAYQTKIFAPNIRQYQEKNGIRYELYSDYSTTHIVMLSDILFVKAGPSLESSKIYSWQNCSITGNTLYWLQWEIFTTLQETSKTSNNYDAETWFRVLFDQGLCYAGRSRAYMGYSYSGWMPSIYTDFDGTPAVIKITSQNYASIDEMRSYTSTYNTQTKAVLKLYNKVNQTNNIKLYQNGSLIYDSNIKYNGSKDITINFNNKGGKIKAVITEPSGYVVTLEAPIYTSSYTKYTSDKNEILVSPTTPIIVIANKNGVKNIYERIKVSIPYNHINIISGKPIQTWSYIEYFTDNNEIVLNSDILGNVLFPTQESTLNYQIKNNKVFVNTIKTDYNSTQAIMNLPEYVLDKNKGFVYEKGKQPNNIITVYGGRKWYTLMTDPLGTYYYQINLSNLGVNKVSVSFNCNYTTTKNLFGTENSYYVLKRTYIPNNPIYRFKNKYTYNQLLKIGGS